MGEREGEAMEGQEEGVLIPMLMSTSLRRNSSTYSNIGLQNIIITRGKEEG